MVIWSMVRRRANEVKRIFRIEKLHFGIQSDALRKLFGWFFAIKSNQLKMNKKIGLLECSKIYKEMHWRMQSQRAATNI